MEQALIQEYLTKHLTKHLSKYVSKNSNSYQRRATVPRRVHQDQREIEYSGVNSERREDRTQGLDSRLFIVARRYSHFQKR